ncbi:hypothetical protein P7K49_005833 [Saguinus oedipus]|uniref:Uncharacterized protein n=1 Tax=Saguinus oedipus TaxID=9490 RepID=A0ABQ9W490_SAGOE|nr:hypothetical protein P7K49_005833 [Saguinus oedipus]
MGRAAPSSLARLKVGLNLVCTIAATFCYLPVGLSVPGMFQQALAGLSSLSKGEAGALAAQTWVSPRFATPRSGGCFPARQRQCPAQAKPTAPASAVSRPSGYTQPPTGGTLLPSQDPHPASLCSPELCQRREEGEAAPPRANEP